MRRVSEAEQKPKSIASLAFNAEVRAAIAARNINQTEFGKIIGRSTSYVNERLNDHKNFTLEELELVCDWLGEDEPGKWLQQVIDRHSGHLNERLASENEGFSIRMHAVLANAIAIHAPHLYSLPQSKLIPILQTIAQEPVQFTRNTTPDSSAEQAEDDAP